MITVSSGPLTAMDLYANSGNLVYVLYLPHNPPNEALRYQLLPTGKNSTFVSRAQKRVRITYNQPVLPHTNLSSTIHRRPLENPRRIA